MPLILWICTSRYCLFVYQISVYCMLLVGKRSKCYPNFDPCPTFGISGGFEVVSAAVPAFYDGLQAFSSSCAAPKVRTVTRTLPPRLQLEEVQRMFNADAWPKQFQQRPPTDKEIALYFFPDGERYFYVLADDISFIAKLSLMSDLTCLVFQGSCSDYFGTCLYVQGT